MGLISSYADDAQTTDGDKFLTLASDGTTKLTPASNVNKYLGSGWTIADDSWSFSSYNSTTKIGVINANSGANAKYSQGQWVMFSQPTLGVKYAIITTVATASLTLTLLEGSALSNEAISLPFYSTAGAPFGVPGNAGNRYYIQTDNNNTISSFVAPNLKMQMGWGQITGTGGNLRGDSIVFPTPFSTVLGVSVSWLAAKSSPAASDITQLTIPINTTEFTIGAVLVSNTGFDVTMRRASGTFSSSTFYGYAWEAWGI